MEITSYIILGLLIVVSPGADFVLVLKNSLGHGRKAGLLTGFGIGTGVCIHISYSILGIGHLISQSMILFTMIKYAGSAYLIYLGLTGIFCPKLTFDAGAAPVPKPHDKAQRYFMQGFLCNMLNPKTMLFFLSVFSQFISPGDDNRSSFALIYGLYISVLHIFWFCLVAYLVTSEKVLAVFQRAGKKMSQACGIGLVAFGTTIAFTN
ncbi:Leucine efflux protein [Vibrio aerogenes CECT 7868]|uniref:Leucine efflux protein n=1 Tax=Vibrio aerogenes CECT 7868 TaxID=1216006 RepID=A0A1M5X2L2_9VIBR|nr:LysE family translocator [Vibrio aerogenes]SHH94087.1 Leucine efflux protein [Vibrio aerogenes CECT 7868]